MTASMQETRAETQYYVFTAGQAGKRDTGIWHALADEWKYRGETNLAVCGRKLRAHGYVIGDEGATPHPVTCRQCNRAPQRMHVGSGAIMGPWLRVPIYSQVGEQDQKEGNRL